MQQLKIDDPNFFSLVEESLKRERSETIVENFICPDWNIYYDLGNPENFENPDNPPKWYDTDGIFDFYEKPFNESSVIEIFAFDQIKDFSSLKDLIKNVDKYKQSILSFFENYTFQDGGAYAAGEHFEYARKTIELFHKKTLNRKDFLVRNLRLTKIILKSDKNVIKLHFQCGWDIEHGLEIAINNGKVAI